MTAPPIPVRSDDEFIADSGGKLRARIAELEAERDRAVGTLITVSNVLHTPDGADVIAHARALYIAAAYASRPKPTRAAAGVTCRGCYALGTACGNCEGCDTDPDRPASQTADSIDAALSAQFAPPADRLPPANGYLHPIGKR